MLAFDMNICYTYVIVTNNKTIDLWTIITRHNASSEPERLSADVNLFLKLYSHRIYTLINTFFFHCQIHPILRKCEIIDCKLCIDCVIMYTLISLCNMYFLCCTFNIIFLFFLYSEA